MSTRKDNIEWVQALSLGTIIGTVLAVVSDLTKDTTQQLFSTIPQWKYHITLFWIPFFEIGFCIEMIRKRRIGFYGFIVACVLEVILHPLHEGTFIGNTFLVTIISYFLFRQGEAKAWLDFK